MRLPPYPKYKPSGVEWPDEVPATWAMMRIKFLSKEPIKNGVGEAADNDDLQWPRYIRITDIGGPRRLREDTFRSLPPEIAFQAPVRVGDILLAAVGATYGKSYLHCIDIGPACFAGYLVRFSPGSHLTAAFAAYWTESTAYWGQVQSRVVQATIQNFSAAKYRELASPLPPLAEQRAIADFLDRETAKIDTLVAKKRTLIERLKEKRIALISRTVTRGLPPEAACAAGLDPHPKLKPSGIDWLGEVPEHWIVVALARITTSRCDGPFGSGLKSEHYTDEGTRVVRLNNIRFAKFDGADAAYIDSDYCHELGDHGVQPGDVLIAGLGDDGHPVGRACVTPADLGPAMVKADCFRFRLTHTKAAPGFIAYQLSSTAAALAGALATGTTRARMNLSETARRAVALPPASEQRAIADFLDRETAKIDGMVAKVETAIERLQEYRTALITAAVTGKIDVREVVA